MTDQHDVAMTLDGHGKGQLILNGVDITHMVRDVHLDAEAGHRPRLVLSLRTSVLVGTYSDARVELDSTATDALKALGWTPPEDSP